MKFRTSSLRSGPLRLGMASAAALALFVALPGNAQAAVSPVPLGTAGSFVVLAGAGVTNTGPTALNGDLGTFPTTTITGTSSLTVTGVNHAGDAVTQGAKTDLVTAFTTAAGEGPTSPIAADLAGQTLAPGVYNSASSIGLTGAVTLDGAGDPNAVFVFQAGSDLTTGSGSRVNLINGAQSCNVFWQVGSSATIGTGSTFVGSIMAQQSVTLTTGAQLDGRALARDGAVTLDTNRITRPAPCVAAPTATATATSTATTAATPTATATPQVSRTPSGGVAAGDGSTSGGNGGGSGLLGLLGLLAGVLAVAGFGGTVVAIRRRRLS